MTPEKLSRRVFHITLCAVVLWPASIAFAAGHAAFAAPSGDVKLSFVGGGRVAKVLVKEGERVRAGQTLVELDDRAERVRVAKLKALADDDTAVRANDARVRQASVDLKRKEGAFRDGAATELEVEHARLEETIAKLTLELARVKQQQARREYEESAIQLERMKLTSPIDGLVEKVHLSAGESADPRAEAVRVVKIDPLWIDARVPIAQARPIRPGQTVRVVFAGRAEPVAGKVIHKAAVGDTAGNTLMVRVEVPNPSSAPAGEHVTVYFTDRSGGDELSRASGKAPEKADQGTSLAKKRQP